MAKGCQGQSSTEMDSTSIEYSAVSRGIYQKVLVQNQTAFVTKNRNEKPVEIKISNAQWKTLVAEFKKLNLEGIPNLKAPTEKRFYDGAAIANIKIIRQGKTYETNGFDHGFPPAEIKKIVTILVAFTEE